VSTNETAASPVFLNGIRIEVEGDGSLRVVGTVGDDKVQVGSTIDLDTSLPVPGSYWICTWEEASVIEQPPPDSDCITVIGVTNNIILNGKDGDDELWFMPVYLVDLGDYLYSSVAPNDLFLYGEAGDDLLVISNGYLEDGYTGTGDDAYVYAGDGDDWIFIEELTVGDDLFTRGQAGSDIETLYDVTADRVNQQPGQGDAQTDENTAVVYGGEITKWIFRGGRGSDNVELGTRLGRNPIFAGSGGRDTVTTKVEVGYGRDRTAAFGHKGKFRFRGAGGGDGFNWLDGRGGDLPQPWQCKAAHRLEVLMGAGNDTTVINDWYDDCAEDEMPYGIDPTSTIDGQNQAPIGVDLLRLVARRTPPTDFTVPNSSYETIELIPG
jgi:hypothetical protein